MDEVSPMMTHEAGAGPRQKRTETIRPRDAWASEAEFDSPTDAAMPRAIKRTQLKPDPQR